MTFVFEFVWGMPMSDWRLLPRITRGKADDGRWIVVAQMLNTTLVIARHDVLCVTDFVGSEVQ